MIKLKKRDSETDLWYVKRVKDCIRTRERYKRIISCDTKWDAIEKDQQMKVEFLENILKKKLGYTEDFCCEEEADKVFLFIKEFIELLSDDEFLQRLLVESKESVKEYVSKKKHFLLYIENAYKKSTLEVINSIVALFIYYELLDSKQKGITIKQELYGRLNIRACPYCNRQFIDPIAIKNEENEEIEKRYNTGDLDHILPKSKYPLYAVSLWNLTPCCKTCNETFKSSDESPILNPWEDGFGDRVELTLYPENNESILNIFFGDTENFSVRWKVLQSKNSQFQDTESNNNQSTQKITKEDKIKNAITMFRLNELYTTHRSEIIKLLATQQKYPEVYDIFLSTFDNGAPEKPKPIEEEDYQTMVLARLTHDIHKMNFEIDMLNNPELRDTEPKSAEDSDTE